MSAPFVRTHRSNCQRSDRTLMVRQCIIKNYTDHAKDRVYFTFNLILAPSMKIVKVPVFELFNLIEVTDSLQKKYNFSNESKLGLLQKLMETVFLKRLVDPTKIETNPLFDFTITHIPPPPPPPAALTKRKADAQEKLVVKKPKLAPSCNRITINFEGPYRMKHSVYCRPNTTFDKLKLFISAKSGVDIDDVSMFLKGMYIQSMHTLEQMKLEDGVTIQVFDEESETLEIVSYLRKFKIQLSFKNLASNVVTNITVDPSKPISEAYSKYAKIHGLENTSYFHFLHKNGSPIKDMNKSAEDNGIYDGDSINVVWNCQVMSLAIFDKNKKINLVHVDISSNVGDVIKKYAATIGVPADKIKFAYKNNVLEPTTALTSLGYLRGSVIIAVY